MHITNKLKCLNALIFSFKNLFRNIFIEMLYLEISSMIQAPLTNLGVTEEIS